MEPHPSIRVPILRRAAHVDLVHRTTAKRLLHSGSITTALARKAKA